MRGHTSGTDRTGGIRRMAMALAAIPAAAFLVPHGATAQEKALADYQEALYETEAEADLTAVLEANRDFSAFLQMVKAADLTSLLEGEGPFTLFVPRNAALQGIDEAYLKGQARANERLREFVLSHVVDEKISAAELAKRGEISPQHRLASGAIEPRSHTVDMEDGRIVIGDNSYVVTADIDAANGVIHVINRPLEVTNPATAEEGG